MKVETKKCEQCRVEVTVTLEADEVKVCTKKVEKIFLREGRVPGFRPGKAPIELIRKEYEPQMKDEETREIIRAYYEKALKEAELDVVGHVGIDQMNFDEAGGGTFVATVEVRPEFKLPTYKGLKIAFNDVRVEDSAVAEQVETMRKGYAKYEDAKEGEAAAEGDFVQIDYTGTVGGKPILELAPDAKVVAQGAGFWTQIEEGRFLKEILEAVKGMKAGETKEGVKATFDKASAPEPLKGKKAVYTVTLKTFRRRILPTDAELVERTKSESIEALTKGIREQMEKLAIAQEEQRRENEAIELLMKKVNFEVPASAVQSGRDMALEEFKQRVQYAGLSAEYVEQNRDKILAEAEESGLRQARLWYVIAAIAKAEKIEAKSEELGKKVIEFVLENAKK